MIKVRFMRIEVYGGNKSCKMLKLPGQLKRLSKRIVRRKVTVEMIEEFTDGSERRTEVEVRNMDIISKAKSMRELLEIAERGMKNEE